MAVSQRPNLLLIVDHSQNSAINIFTDFVFATLPIPVIWPLQINMRTKITLLCILSLGYL
jgi:hypothetical protein